MNNNDILIRIRYALNLKDGQMVKIFKLGGVEVTEEEVKKMLTKVKEEFGFQDADSNETLPCNNKMLDAFLNGLITFKRGPQEKKSGQPEKGPFLRGEGGQDQEDGGEGKDEPSHKAEIFL